MHPVPLPEKGSRLNSTRPDYILFLSFFSSLRSQLSRQETAVTFFHFGAITGKNHFLTC